MTPPGAEGDRQGRALSDVGVELGAVGEQRAGVADLEGVPLRGLGTGALLEHFDLELGGIAARAPARVLVIVPAADGDDDDDGGEEHAEADEDLDPVIHRAAA